MKEVVLSLGSNLGDREEVLRQAAEHLAVDVGEITASSSIYETQAWGFDSFDFLNQVVVVKTKMCPVVLLEKLKEIEYRLGRTEKSQNAEGRHDRIYAARPIDIDILLYENEVVETDVLTIPHPRITERKFVLAPLAELFPVRVFPYFDKSFRNMLSECNDDSYIMKNGNKV